MPSTPICRRYPNEVEYLVPVPFTGVGRDFHKEGLASLGVNALKEFTEGLAFLEYPETGGVGGTDV